MVQQLSPQDLDMLVNRMVDMRLQQQQQLQQADKQARGGQASNRNQPGVEPIIRGGGSIGMGGPQKVCAMQVASPHATKMLVFFLYPIKPKRHSN